MFGQCPNVAIYFRKYSIFEREFKTRAKTFTRDEINQEAKTNNL